MSRAADTPSDGKPGLALLQPVRMNTGRAFVVGAAGWRVVDQVAQRIDADADDPTLRTLAARAAGSECLALAALLQRQRQPQPGFATDMLEDPGDDRHSFSIARGVPPNASPTAEQIVVAVYGKPSARALNARGAPAPIASLPRFGRVTTGAKVVWGGGPQAGIGSTRLDRRLGSHPQRHVARRGRALEHLCAVALGSEILQAQDEKFRAALDKNNRKICDRE